MTDIVDRLRFDGLFYTLKNRRLREEAADEIERLRAGKDGADEKAGLTQARDSRARPLSPSPEERDVGLREALEKAITELEAAKALAACCMATDCYSRAEIERFGRRHYQDIGATIEAARALLPSQGEG